MHPCVAEAEDSYIGTFIPWFVVYGCFIEDIQLGSHLCIKAKHFWPEGDCFRQVPLYISILPRPLQRAFHRILHSKYRICTCPIPLE